MGLWLPKFLPGLVVLVVQLLLCYRLVLVALVVQLLLKFLLGLVVLVGL